MIRVRIVSLTKFRDTKIQNYSTGIYSDNSNIDGAVLCEKTLSGFSYAEEVDITNLPNGRYNIEVYPSDNRV